MIIHTIDQFCRRHWFQIGLVIAFILPWIAFGRSLFQDFAAIDDGFLIVNNPIVHGLDAWRIKLAFTTFDPELYIPFTLLSFQIDWVLGHGMPFIFHITNLLLQSTNAILLAGLFLLWTKNKSIALAAALIFAVHPFNTEAVVWAAGRKDLLSTVFFLLALIAYKKWSDDEKSYVRLIALGFFFFLCALLSKVSAVTLVAVMILDVLLLKSHRSKKEIAGIFVTFFTLGLVFLWVASLGKERILSSSTLLETIVMAQKSAFFYITKFFFPSQLTVIYPYEGTISLLEPEFFLPAICNAFLLWIAFRQWKRRPLVSYGILFYFLTLAPTFFNFHKGDLYFFAVDRYAYVPMIGLLLATSTVVAEIVDSTLIQKRYAWGLFGIIIVLFIGISAMQTRVWDSPDALFGHAMELYPEAASPRMALASIFRDQNRLSDAFTIVHEGARYSDHPGLNIEAGLVYSANGEVANAKSQFAMALKKNPTLAPAMFYLGFLEEHDHEESAAIAWYEKAIVADPSYVTVRVHLAELLIVQSEFEEAEKQLAEALKWNSVSVEAMQGMIDLETARKDSAQANYWKEMLMRINDN